MRTPEKLLVFDLEGYMAHFRKFYTNSSSLTYSFPPRTVVTGLIAGIIGRERDSYYEEFSVKNSAVGVSIIGSHRKITQTINFIRTKSKNELNGSGGPTQIPLEILLGEKGKVHFRIYFSHLDLKLLDEVAERITKNRYVYPPYLGISEFTAQLNFVEFIEKNGIKVNEPEETNYIDTVINIEDIRDRGLVPDERKLKILKEKMTVEFNQGREISEVSSFVFEESGKKLPVRLKSEYLTVNVNGKERNITFMS